MHRTMVTTGYNRGRLLSLNGVPSEMWQPILGLHGDMRKTNSSSHIPWWEVSFCRRERNWVVDGVAELEYPLSNCIFPIQFKICNSQDLQQVSNYRQYISMGHAVAYQSHAAGKSLEWSGLGSRTCFCISLSNSKPALHIIYSYIGLLSWAQFYDGFVA